MNVILVFVNEMKKQIILVLFDKEIFPCLVTRPWFTLPQQKFL
jgi:hypothetical protein